MNPKEMKLMLISALAMLFLVSCGGGSGSNSGPSTKSNNGVAQKGPFSIGSNVVITELDASGISTGSVIESKISSKSGKFSYGTVTTNPYTYYRIQVTGRFFDENIGSVSENEITLSTITNSPKNSSINVLTHWLSLRTDAQLAYDKTLKTSLDQSQQELLTIFGIENPNALDVTTSSEQLDEDNAMLLLLSGALMEASQKYKVSSQTIIDEVGEDFADDGQLSEKGDEWFIRLQALIKNNPSAHTKKYAKAINDKLGYDVSLDKKLPLLIPLASRPVANVPEELLAAPSETVTLDGSASHDSGEIINFTWFRVDQQTQYNIQVSDQFSATPTITVPDEATVLAAPNQEISLLYALVVTDVDKLTHTGVVKVTIRIPPLLNNPPVANSQALVTDEDSPIAITLSASDADGDTINFILSSTPLSTPNGLVVLDPSLPNVVYTPSQDYFGTDSFTFIVNDGFANSNIATVDIQVNPVNDPPTAADLTVPLDLFGNPFLITLTGNDPDGNNANLIYEIVTLPTPFKGSLIESIGTLTGNSVTYQSNSASSPDPDSFTYRVRDELGLVSNIATVNLIIGNTPPTAIATFNGSSPFNELSIVELFGAESSDDDGFIETYLWEQIGGPVVTLRDPTTANPTFTAPSVSSVPLTLLFRLTVTDDDGATSSDTVDITVVNVVSSSPTANAGPDQTVGFPGEVLDVDIDGSGSSDPMGLELTYSWEVLPSSTFPTLNIYENESFATENIDTPQAFFTVNSSPATINLRLTVTNTDGVSDTDEVTIIIQSRPRANYKGVCILDYFPSSQLISLSGNDPDGDNNALIYEIVTLPTKGTLDVGIGSLTGSSVVYTSDGVNSGFPEIDSFTFKVTDEQGWDSVFDGVINIQPATTCP